MQCTILGLKTNTLISCGVMLLLIFACVFAKSRFSLAPLNIQLLKVAVKMTLSELVFVENNSSIYWVSYIHSLNCFSEAKDPVIYDPSSKITCKFPRSLLPIKTP